MKLSALILCLIPLFTEAQQYDRRDTIGVMLKVSPLSFVPAYVGPCARLSLEHRIRHTYWAAQYDAGVFFYSSRGFTVRTELKRYIYDGEPWSGPYVSAELQYKYQRYSVAAIHDTLEYYGYVDFPAFDVTSKNVECLTFKLGSVENFPGGLVLEAFCGLGIRFRQVRNSLSAADDANMPSTADYGPNLLLNQAGNRIYPNIVAGAKIGFRFH